MTTPWHIDAARFTNVTYHYPDAPRAALKNVSVVLPAGEVILVAGTSGVGKSTFLRCLNGLVPHFSGGVLVGSVRVLTLDPVQVGPRVMSRQVGFVFQDPESQFVMERVEDEVAFALENAALPAQEMRIRVEETLDLLDLAPLRNRRLDTLSGGERQRVAIASALALRPHMLVLDEPTSQLDPKSAEDVLYAALRLNMDLGLTVVIAEHRLERVLPFADLLLYLPRGQDPILADPRTVLREVEIGVPLIRVARELGWEPLPLTIKEGRRHSRQWIEQHQPPPLSDSEPDHSATPSLPKPYIQLQQVSAGYGARPVVHQIDLELSGGEIVVLVGRNGSGKTTLLKSIVGLVRPHTGSVFVDGQNTENMEVATICQYVGFLPQNPSRLLFADTVRQELMITLQNHGLAVDVGKIDELLRVVGLQDYADVYPRDLSVGERQRVALAAILVPQPRAFLLDEPTRGLDYGAKENLVELLRTMRDSGMAIAVVTHDVEFAAAIAGRVVMMSQGEIIAAGSPRSILGASPLFAPQIARLFPSSGWLTPEDVLQTTDAHVDSANRIAQA